MKREQIPIGQFVLPVVSAWKEGWMLLAAGSRTGDKFNVMTVSWGSMGEMWMKPMAMVVVRPSRHTYQFMEKSPGFSLSAFPSQFKDKLTLCGSKSGRDIDKVKACGFTPIPLLHIDTPGFDEAELIVECRKMYYDDYKPAHFLDPDIEGNYNGKDYHRIYFGEILAVHGTPQYRRKA